MSPPQTCRGCGCTDDNACSTPTGPCHWVEPGLCSACASMSDTPAHGDLVNPDDLTALQTVEPLGIRIGGIEAMFLMSALQLACRHRELSGPVRDTVQDFARVLQKHISVTPALAALCEAGWDPACDLVDEPKRGSGLILPGDPRFGL